MRAVVTALVWLALLPAGTALATTDPEPPATPPPSTFNEFYPEDQSISDCLGLLQKPNCGSDARGGWAQYTVFGALLGGLGFIGWRIVRTARRARPAAGDAATVRAPDATNARTGDDDPAP